MFDSIMEAICLFQKRESKTEEMSLCLENLKQIPWPTKQANKQVNNNKKQPILNLYKHQLKIYTWFSF